MSNRDSPSGGNGGNGGYGGGGAAQRPPQASFGQGPSPYGGGNNVEMSNLPSNNSYGGGGGYGGGNNGGYGGGASNGGGATSILDECSEIDRGIEEVEQNLNQLRNLHRAALNDTDTSGGSRVNRELDGLSSDTMTLYRSLVERVRKIKSNPASRQGMNARQVERIDGRLKNAIRQYQEIDADFRRETQSQIARQYRIVKPNASEDEVAAAVDGSDGGQVFAQALMQSNRQGQATAALNNVRARHDQILKIERQMTELAQLFQDMNTLVVQQEVAVTQIEQKAEEVVENLDKGNEEIGVAVKTARATRRKKWWCLGITVLIIVIVVVAILAYLGVNGKLGGGGGNDNNNNTKRGLVSANVQAVSSTLSRTVPSVSRQFTETISRARSLQPGAKFRKLE
ncbi:unnamed protein product [Parascedosporium putredinis]|uniref:t-SNARE coiled-coil homology domain-containing protein n=1 Tax=Parascedosporium putredinis TaxID=1442378 RepID=A0A9P1MEB7_9PEZI|nr:unnamed protein product [Parascedosporium putredinis]CAI8002307.1 unnamed protein product [Parascedosporium putredinis]